MIEDHEAPTPEQRLQMGAGQTLALSVAVHALIATHPDPSVFSAKLDELAQVTEGIFLRRVALQHDDGLRQGYSEAMRSIRSLVPKG